uniref:Uncharacterized protein n=1 Tax=Arundo donax TaxID=35708 RepID=A0A0A9CVQ8_ARUDO
MGSTSTTAQLILGAADWHCGAASAMPTPPSSGGRLLRDGAAPVAGGASSSGYCFHRDEAGGDRYLGDMLQILQWHLVCGEHISDTIFIGKKKHLDEVVRGNLGSMRFWS